MTGKGARSNILFFLTAIGQFKNRLLLVFVLLMLDTVSASLGIGMVLPVFQTLLDPLHKNTLFSDFLPFIDEYEPGLRLVFLALMTVVVFFFKGVISMVTSITTNLFLQKLRFYWIARIGENILQAPLLNIVRQKQGDMLNDWFNETLAAANFYRSSLNYLSSTALAVALLILGLLINWQAMLSMVGLGVVALMMVRKLTYKNSAILYVEKLRANQALNSSMVEDLANVRDLKLMSAEKRRLHHLVELSEKLKSIFVRGAILAEIPRVTGEFLAILFLMGFVLVSSIFFDMDPQTVLPMIAFFSIAFYRLVSASSIAMSSRVRALNDLQSVRRIQDLLNQEQHREILSVGLPLLKIDTDIRFQNLLFKYEEESQALKTVNAVIPKGKMTLLVGPSGSGKSTMLDLLMRLIEPLSGDIQINGRSAQEYCLCDWRRCFGYVSQDAALFNCSIRLNMLLANPGANEEDIQLACRLAGADGFINEMINGYDTAVGDRGFSLSGGQRKRIAIARALIRKPSVLILDEATTSFEQQLELELLARLRDEMPELTIIQVTHRIKFTDSVDWIVIMENGNIVACGPKKDVAIIDYG